MIELDGSFGEGGGQILRTALSLSCLTGTPFRLTNIRKHRTKPGLRPQHLMAVRALKSLCRSEVEGDKPASQCLVFRPRGIIPGNYDFDIGTAGSTSLLLQALLPPLIFADGLTQLHLTGGTHVPMSPPFDYLHSVFRPFLDMIGTGVGLSIETYGFYPHGGGRIRAVVTPVAKGRTLYSIDRMNPIGHDKVQGISAVGNLPLGIAERQRDAALEALEKHDIEAHIETISVPTSGRGTYIFLHSLGECPAGFSSTGRRGKRAEAVGGETVQELLGYCRARSCMDPHLADQILIYLGLAQGRSAFTTSIITEHLLTNLAVIQRFLPAAFDVRGSKGQPGIVTVNGIGYRR